LARLPSGLPVGRKWRVIPGWQQLLSDESKPLCFWRRVVMEL